MATYSAGCSKVGSFNYAQYFTLYVQLSERDSDTSSNTSVVDYTVFCQSSGSGSINAKHYLYFNLGGNVYRDETVQVNVSSPNAYIGIASGSMTVNHNSDGTASLNFSAQIQASSYGVSASLSDTFTCSTIPRYFTSTPTIKCNSVTANSASMSWTTSENCSRVQYRIGSNGNWVDVESDANRKSGSYTISGLSAGTTYTIYGDYMRRDSGLWSQTKPSTTVTTLAYATVSQSLKSKTETSIVMNWSANATCDYLYYQIKKGNGSWSARTNYGSVNASSGTMTFNNLDPYTEYSIQIHVKRKDSQLISNYSSWTTTTTYAYPYANSMPNFTIGNRLTVGIYNPLNRSISIYAIAADNTEKGGDTTTGTSMAGYENASWQEFWYSSIPNAASGKYKIKVVYGSHTETRTGGTYSADSSTSRPTFGNWEYEDTNPVTLALTGNDQTVIKNYSTIRGLVSVANKSIPNKSASMSRYTFTIGNNSVLADYSGDSDVEMGDILATTSDMTMSATDSRNISTTVSKTPASFLEYFNIAIDKENSNLTRKNSISSETILTLKGTFWNYSFGEITNTIKTFTIEYKATNTEDDYTTVTSPSLTIEENEFSLNASIWGDLGADGFSPGGTFSVRITVGDELSESIYIITLGAGNPPMAIGKRGVAFGKPYDEALGNTVQINGNIVAQASDKSQMTSYNYNGITIGVEDTQNGKIASIGRSAIATVVRQFGQITKSAGFGITNDNPQMSLSDGTNFSMWHTNKLYFQNKGQVTSKSGGSWIAGRDNATVINRNYGQQAGYSFNPVISSKTTSGAWTVGNLSGNEKLVFSYTTDTNYASGTNTQISAELPVSSGTIQVAVVLYNNATGSTGTITLSETANNFTYLELYYATNRESKYWHHCERIYMHSGGARYFSLFNLVGSSSSGLTAKGSYGTGTVNGTSITRGANYNGEFEWTGGSSGIAANTVSDCIIYRVVGYR